MENGGYNFVFRLSPFAEFVTEKSLVLEIGLHL